ncbi:hypothetical protein [Runella zeae]|uniref:hypothetical protein n=1 Tax=Runella zeae TaxID=94255 RepID=UPI0004237E64|nr:hypothetical protein [Runella zeae]
MKKHLYAFLFVSVALLGGCSKSEPEPEPAEQVIGTYNVDKITIAFKYNDSPVEESQSYVLPFKGTGGELSAILDVSKTSSNVVTISYIETAKYTDGTTDKNTDVYSSIELKKNESNSAIFDMFNAGAKSGTIGGGTIALDDIVNAKDSTGRAYTYTFRVTGKKAQ